MRVVVIALLINVLSQSAAAQSGSPGAMVRAVLSSGDTIEGRLLSSDSSRLTFERYSAHLVVPRDKVAELFERTTSAGHDGLTFGLVGAGVGALIGALSSGSTGCVTEPTISPGRVDGCGRMSLSNRMALGAGLGGGFGFLMGSLAGSTDVRWVPLSIR